MGPTCPLNVPHGAGQLLLLRGSGVLSTVVDVRQLVQQQGQLQQAGVGPAAAARTPPPAVRWQQSLLRQLLALRGLRVALRWVRCNGWCGDAQVVLLALEQALQVRGCHRPMPLGRVTRDGMCHEMGCDTERDMP